MAASVAVPAFLGSFDDVTVKPAETTKEDRFTFTAEAHMAEKEGESFEGSPYLYHLRHTEGVLRRRHDVEEGEGHASPRRLAGQGRAPRGRRVRVAAVAGVRP